MSVSKQTYLVIRRSGEIILISGLVEILELKIKNGGVLELLNFIFYASLFMYNCFRVF